MKNVPGSYHGIRGNRKEVVTKNSGGRIVNIGSAPNVNVINRIAEAVIEGLTVLQGATYIPFGDSISTGSLASTHALSFPGLLNTLIGGIENSQAVGNTGWFTMAKNAQASLDETVTDALITVMGGLNDYSRSGGLNTRTDNMLESCLRTILINAFGSLFYSAAGGTVTVDGTFATSPNNGSDRSW